MSTVLVTGGSGFIGSHCILQLLAAGHEVRTTVRSLKREGDVRAMLKAGRRRARAIACRSSPPISRSDAGWSDAVAGCEYVLHVASPFPPSIPEERGRADRAGARRRAARAARRRATPASSAWC